MAFAGGIILIHFLLLFILGTAGVVLGITGIVVSNNKKREGQPVPKVLCTIFSAILAIGIVIAMIPVSIFSLILADSVINASTMEDEFVETDIEIDEIGYQDERFTSDGVVYESLDFTLTCEEEVAEVPMFSYREDGLFGMFAGGYYCLVENEHGLTL